MPESGQVGLEGLATGPLGLAPGSLGDEDLPHLLLEVASLLAQGIAMDVARDRCHTRGRSSENLLARVLSVPLGPVGAHH